MNENYLEKIKLLHNEANEKASSDKYEDIDRVTDIFSKLFYEGSTDWLIEQTEKLENIQKLSKVEDMSLAEFAIEILKIIDGKEVQKRKLRT